MDELKPFIKLRKVKDLPLYACWKCGRVRIQEGHCKYCITGVSWPVNNDVIYKRMLKDKKYHLEVLEP